LKLFGLVLLTGSVWWPVTRSQSCHMLAVKRPIFAGPSLALQIELLADVFAFLRTTWVATKVCRRWRNATIVTLRSTFRIRLVRTLWPAAKAALSNGDHACDGTSAALRRISGARQHAPAPAPAPDADALESLAAAVEEAAFELCSHSASSAYHAKARQLNANLRGNAELRQRLVQGELAPAALVRMSIDELASGALAAARRGWQQKSAELTLPEGGTGGGCSSASGGTSSSASGTFLCQHCGGSRTKTWPESDCGCSDRTC
jgi:hypothetical protein